MDQYIHPASQLGSHARIRASSHIFKSCKPQDVDELTLQGWTTVRENKTSTRMSRPKDHGRELEDRVWTLLYRMGFTHLSGEGGVILKHGEAKNQIDNVAVDNEVAVAVECKSLFKPGRRPAFQGELGKFALLREKFIRELKTSTISAANARQTGFAMFLRNAILSDTERQRAKDANVVLFDSQDLNYYEQLTSHIGPAARYQFLADLLPGRKVPGLSLSLPAIRSKMGGHTCYTFSISPDHLLKLAYVSHRSKGRASDVDAYQRMISKARLKSIQSYIENESNIFPTNIVLTFDSPQLFEPTKQDHLSSETLGWLRLKGTYKSAWVIDGQHRLFAYAQSARSSTSRLTVLAFEGLEADVQAELFININGEQRSVKKSLLQELYSELHWNSSNDSSRIKAVVAKAIKTLDEDASSPFYSRIKSAEGSPSPYTSVYFGNLYSALSPRELYRRKTRKGKEDIAGPLWSSSNEKMVKRTATVVNGWFRPIVEPNLEWWELGSAPGGGIAMNDSVKAMLMALRSVIDYVESKGVTLHDLDDDEVVTVLRPYAEQIGLYLADMNEEDRKRYRGLRGAQGQTTRLRRFQQQIAKTWDDFDPHGLSKFLAEEKQETNSRSHQIITDIEILLQTNIIDMLKSEYGNEVSEWWVNGVPEKSRKPAIALADSDGYKRGGYEKYLNLIDYRDIIIQSSNWSLLSPYFAFDSPNANKDTRTKWLVTINSIRKITMHASSGQTVSLEQLDELESIYEELGSRLKESDYRSI